MTVMFDMLSTRDGQVSEPVRVTADEADQFALWATRVAAVVLPAEETITIELTARVFDDGQEGTPDV